MKIPNVVLEVLGTSAPTLLSALTLPPPFNMLASTVVSSALGRFARPATNGVPPQSPGDTAGPAATDTRPLTPAEVVATVEQNAANPDFLLALRSAESDLKKYEIQAGLRFAELQLEDRRRAGDFQQASDIGGKAFMAGTALVAISLVGMLAMIILLLFVAMGRIQVSDANSPMAVAAFGLIGTAVGFINGIAGAIVSFYWGSSQSSKEKSLAMEKQFEQFGASLSRAQREVPVQRAPAVIVPSSEPGGMPTVITSDADGTPRIAAAAMAAPASPAAAHAEVPPVIPASPTLAAELVPDLSQSHSKFADGVKWALVASGISVEGGSPERTGGAPATVTRIWNDFGEPCRYWARRFGVPVELIVATIATESGGDPDAERDEPQINDKSVGLMQTLITTARAALDRPNLSGRDLRDPSLSIEAGTAYIAAQRKSTLFDPPLVAAAYNAGSLRREEAEANRWRLVCYPKNTGHHIDRFVSWFGDAMRVSAEQGWSDGGRIPSFAAAFGPAGAVAATPAAAAAASVALSLLRSFALPPIPLGQIETNGALVREIQARLTDLGYLDPPADGLFRKTSNWAFAAFCARNGISHGGTFARVQAQALVSPASALPDIAPVEQWLGKVIDYMRRQGYWIARHPGCRNIVYLEGVDEDGTLNQDLPDRFNDLRLVFWLEDDGTFRRRAWQATTEPGRYWTENPMDPRGAARIAFGQYGAWRVGMHRDDHEGLVQVRNLKIHRDLNKDFRRTDDRTFSGLYGINQHWGYDRPESSINRASAGCLVGRTKDGHREFMAEIKQDPRYLSNDSYTFLTTILPGNKVLQ
ncbi:peptidoglycan-binding protein [Tropicimonas sp.]|uniref:peptidoglycan-binding protein n=1 Tax=Tropicimonas sp. TaxID=2067044 RepID=UPI003A89B901